MIELEEVTSQNWRACAAIAPGPGQDRFVAAVEHYLCVCAYGGVWKPLAVTSDDQVVGFCMWGLDEDGSHWIGGLVIDAARQGQGIGRAAVRALVEWLGPLSGDAGLALSYLPDNVVARRLYADLGFVETGEVDEDEVVARLP